MCTRAAPSLYICNDADRTRTYFVLSTAVSFLCAFSLFFLIHRLLTLTRGASFTFGEIVFVGHEQHCHWENGADDFPATNSKHETRPIVTHKQSVDVCIYFRRFTKLKQSRKVAYNCDGKHIWDMIYDICIWNVRCKSKIVLCWRLFLTGGHNFFHSLRSTLTLVVSVLAKKSAET